MIEKAVAIGIFLCDCGKSLANIDFSRVRESAGAFQDVVYVGLSSSLCVQEGVEEMLSAIKRENINRLVIAGCSPELKSNLLRRVAEQAGLNENFISVANIREQCSWVHEGDVTDKALELIKMAASKVRILQPVEVKGIPVEAEILVVGGGFSGMKSALELSGLGFRATLVEEGSALGEREYQQGFALADKEIIGPLKKAVEENGNIEVLTSAQIIGVDGKAGNFKARIRSGEKQVSKSFGAIVLATEYMTRTSTQDSGPELSTYIISPRKLNELLAAPAGLERKPETIGFILDMSDDSSRLSVLAALKNASAIKEMLGSEVYILCKSVKVDGEGMEKLYREAREHGVLFLKFEEKPHISAENGRVKVSVRDLLLGDELVVLCDLLVAEEEVLPPEGTRALSSILNVRTDSRGFYQDRNVFLCPVASERKGIFFVGGCRGESDPVRASTDISSAAMGFVRLFSPTRGILEVKPQKCRACLSCIRVCPHSAIDLVKVETGEEIARIHDLACGQCGICTAICPANAIRFEGYADEQILAEIEAMGDGDRVVAFCCEKSACRAADKAGRARLRYPSNVRIIPVPCAGRVDIRHILRAFEKGSSGVLVMGCQEGACQHLTGNARARERVRYARGLLKEVGIGADRIKMVNLAPDQAQQFVREVEQMAGKVEVR